MEVIKMKNMSLKAKILMGVSAIAAVGAVAVLVMILATSEPTNSVTPDSASNLGETSESTNSTTPGNTSEPTNNETPGSTSTPSSTATPGGSQIGDSGMDNTDLSALIAALPDKEALNEIHSLFSGYWITTGNSFVGFIYEEDEPGIDYGLFRASFGRRGKIIDARNTGKYTMTITIRIPAVPATEMDDAKPERIEEVYIDVEDYNQHNRMKIKIDSLADGGWYTYKFGGGSQMEGEIS